MKPEGNDQSELGVAFAVGTATAATRTAGGLTPKTSASRDGRYCGCTRPEHPQRISQIYLNEPSHDDSSDDNRDDSCTPNYGNS
jgi:hypothetical protein